MSSILFKNGWSVSRKKSIVCSGRQEAQGAGGKKSAGAEVQPPLPLIVFWGILPGMLSLFS